MSDKEEIKRLEERIRILEQQPRYYPPVIIHPQPYIPIQNPGCPICHMNPPFCPGYHVTC